MLLGRLGTVAARCGSLKKCALEDVASTRGASGFLRILEEREHQLDKPRVPNEVRGEGEDRKLALAFHGWWGRANGPPLPTSTSTFSVSVAIFSAALANRVEFRQVHLNELKPR